MSTLGMDVNIEQYRLAIVLRGFGYGILAPTLMWALDESVPSIEQFFMGLFPEIKQLRKSQREDYMIMDGQFFSFDAISKIISIKEGKGISTKIRKIACSVSEPE